MKSGLEGRNNVSALTGQPCSNPRLNEVRPRRPEQSGAWQPAPGWSWPVSMKSGLEGRNNLTLVSKQMNNTWVSMKSGLEGRNNLG